MVRRILFACGITMLYTLMTGCSSTTAINDFFGIEMPPSEVNYFKIVGYTESSGISYQSTRNMNPDLYAWAGLEGTNIRIKITNNSNELVEINYNKDQYLLRETDGNELILDKGNILDYENLNPLNPNSSIELILELPKESLKSLYTERNAKFLNDMTREHNTTFYDIARIKNLQIKLGYTKTIILKAVTELKK
jgi:hypothetical protein